MKIITLNSALTITVLVIGLIACNKQNEQENNASSPTTSKFPYTDTLDLEISVHMAVLDSIVNGVKSGEITAYKAYKYPYGKELTERVEIVDVDSEIFYPENDTIGYEDPDTGEWVEQIIDNTFHKKDVQKLRFVKEWNWSVEKNTSESRILSIAPLKGHNPKFLKMVFWVHSD